MILPPLVSLGDLLRACRTLGMPPERYGEVAAHLGLELAVVPTTAAPEPAGGGTLPIRSLPEVAPRAPSEVVPSVPIPRRSSRSSRDRSDSRRLPSRLQALPPQRARPPLTVLRAASIDTADAKQAPDSAPPPLFTPNWTREIVLELMVTCAEDGPVDAAAAVALLANQEPLYVLPRLPYRTLVRGAQVLIDAGDALVPFAHDQRELVRNLERFVGASALETLRFVGTPSRGAGRGRRRRWGAWQPPARPKPILVVSDLGIAHPRSGERALPSEWARFAARARRARCPVVALVPYPRERVSPPLQRLMAIVEWDRGTRAQDVRRWIAA